jgi:hypothetical protein
MGIVRKEARLTFLRRLIESLELSLSKLDAIVIGTSSSLGRLHGNGHPSSSAPASCIACDRPLRMRITSTPLGRLQARVAQNQELSPKSKRKQLHSQAQRHPPSQHTSSESFHSNALTSSTSGRKKGLMFGGMTLPTADPSSLLPPATTLGMDHFQQTLAMSEDDSVVPSPRALIPDTVTDTGIELNKGQQATGEANDVTQSTSVLANELRKLVKMSASTPQLSSTIGPGIGTSTEIATSTSTTALTGYSKSLKKNSSQRPKSAGPAAAASGGGSKIKSTPLTYTGPLAGGAGSGGGGALLPASSEDVVTPKYVKKGGFKMRTTKTMPQERLVESLSRSYLQDQSFPLSSTGAGGTSAVGTGSRGTATAAEIFFPASDLQRMQSSLETAGSGLNLSSVSQGQRGGGGQ